MNVFPTLETERLMLREVTMEDAPDMLSYLSDEKVAHQMGVEPYLTAKSVEEEISWYTSIWENGTGIRWGIMLKQTDTIIGSCGFLNRETKHSRAEIGYELHPAYWRRGIASEAIEAVVQFGYYHLQLERIEAIIDPLNVPSQKVLEKHGFEREGLLRHYEYNFGRFNDVYIYAGIKSDFR